MYEHPPLSVLMVSGEQGGNVQLLTSYLKEIAHLRIEESPKIPSDLSPWRVIITSGGVRDNEVALLESFLRAGNGWLNLIGPDVQGTPELFGARPEAPGQACELRVVFNRSDNPLSARLPDAIYLQEQFHPMVLLSDDAEMVLYTDWHFQHHAVLVERPVGEGKVACTTLRDFSNRVLCQILYRVILDLSGFKMPEGHLGIGLLGYAPSVGQYHGQGVVQTPGLELQAACDLSPERLKQARNDFPGIKTHATAEILAEDPDVDLVIIATPPNTHAALALKMMAAGKHVICEKPLALNRAETATMVAMAQQQGVHLSCHQNRRWDTDYLAIKNALAKRLIGDLFYMETFVGGFSHPCGYWHSDQVVSGGMTYDWGAHYIDWIVGLHRKPIEAVVGSRHKRVWHDVTNADQERIQIRFADGMEAEFIHSDIAAMRKPKWYLLGTQGAIVGNWQDVTEYQIDPVHYFKRHDIPATEMSPELHLHRHHGSGELTTTRLAQPDRQVFGFHNNLADHLLTGEPLIAPLADSLQVVAVLEAAARSMENGARVEIIDA